MVGIGNLFPFEVTGIQQREAGTRNRETTLTLMLMQRASRHHNGGPPVKERSKIC